MNNLSLPSNFVPLTLVKSHEMYDIYLVKDEGNRMYMLRHVKNEKYRSNIAEELLFYEHTFENFSHPNLVFHNEHNLLVEYIDKPSLEKDMESKKFEGPSEVVIAKLPLAVAEYQSVLHKKSNRFSRLFWVSIQIPYLIRKRVIDIQEAWAFLICTLQRFTSRNLVFSHLDLSYDNIIVMDGSMYLYDFGNLSNEIPGYDLFFFINHFPRKISEWTWEFVMVHAYTSELTVRGISWSRKLLKESFIQTTLAHLFIAANRVDREQQIRTLRDNLDFILQNKDFFEQKF